MDFSDIWLAVSDLSKAFVTNSKVVLLQQLAKCINYTPWQRTSEVAFAWFLCVWTSVLF